MGYEVSEAHCSLLTAAPAVVAAAAAVVEGPAAGWMLEC